jgi:hypothetical protein
MQSIKNINKDYCKKFEKVRRKRREFERIVLDIFVHGQFHIRGVHDRLSLEVFIMMTGKTCGSCAHKIFTSAPV